MWLLQGSAASKSWRDGHALPLRGGINQVRFGQIAHLQAHPKHSIDIGLLLNESIWTSWATPKNCSLRQRLLAGALNKRAQIDIVCNLQRQLLNRPDLTCQSAEIKVVEALINFFEFLNVFFEFIF